MLPERRIWMSSYAVTGCVVAASVAIAVVLLRSEPGARMVPIVIPRLIEVPVAPPAPAPPPAQPPTEVREPTPPDTVIPTVTVPCIDDSTKLMSDGEQPILCWDAACWAYDRER